MKYKILAGICLLTVSWTVQEARGAAGAEPLDFKEVYDLLRTNLTGHTATFRGSLGCRGRRMLRSGARNTPSFGNKATSASPI